MCLSAFFASDFALIARPIPPPHDDPGRVGGQSAQPDAAGRPSKSRRRGLSFFQRLLLLLPRCQVAGGGAGGSGWVDRGWVSTVLRTRIDVHARFPWEGNKNVREVMDSFSWIFTLEPRHQHHRRDSKACPLCGASFSLLFRRHHCRNCGGLTCALCSSKKLAAAKYVGRADTLVE